MIDVIEDVHPVDSSEHRRQSRAEIANQTPHPCDLCGVLITNLSCYGWWDWTDTEEGHEEAELVHCCWKCRKRVEEEE